MVGKEMHAEIYVPNVSKKILFFTETVNGSMTNLWHQEIHNMDS